MQTEVRPPPREPELGPPPSPKRWPGRIVAILLILVALFLVTGVAFLANYDPVCGNCGGVGGVNGPGAKSLGSFTSPHGESFNAYGVDLVPGKEEVSGGYPGDQDPQVTPQVGNWGGDKFFRSGSKDISWAKDRKSVV